MALTNPFIGAWMDEQEIAFRNAAEGYLLRAIELGLIPGAKPESFSLFPNGTSSVVFKIETDDGPRVVKMSHAENLILREAAFLKAWRSAGINTPDISVVHSVDKQLPVEFMVMEHIDKPILREALTTEELVSSGIAREMGRMLARMHSVHGQGFGSPLIEDFARGKFETFSEDMEPVLRRISPFLLEKNLIHQEDLEIARKAIHILEQDFVTGNTIPTLIHGDFRPYNMFYSQPITVFDPHPKISHPMIDLALTLLKPLAESEEFGRQEGEEITAGYYEKGESAEHVFNAAMVLQSMRLLFTWSRKDKHEKVEKMKSILKSYQNRI